MKVLHVISSVSARTGGPRMVIRDLTRFQARAGMHVTIFTTNIDYPHGNLDVPVNVPVKDHGVFRYHFAVQLITPLISFPMAAKLISSLRRYDMVHIHGLYRFPTTFTALLARAYGIPFIITPHGSLDPVIYYQSAVNLTAKRVYENLLEKQNLHKASAIHFASTKEMQRAGFLKLKAPGFVVPQGIDWSRFKNLPSRGYLRNRLDLDEEAAVILFLGRIHFIKGLDLLVRAFATVAGNIEHAVLVIAGPDNDGYVHTVKEWIESHGLASRVFLLPMLDGNEVVQAYADANVFALPSYAESFGVAAAEAMACGLPVVLSDRVSIATEVQAAKSGLVVTPDSPAIAQAIMSLIEDTALAQQMGAAGRSYAERHYSYNSIIDKVTCMYKAAMARHKALDKN